MRLCHLVKTYQSVIKVRRWPIMSVLSACLCVLFLSACGGGGGDESAESNANASDWNTMQWDQGQWQ